MDLTGCREIFITNYGSKSALCLKYLVSYHDYGPPQLFKLEMYVVDNGKPSLAQVGYNEGKHYNLLMNLAGEYMHNGNMATASELYDQAVMEDVDVVCPLLQMDTFFKTKDYRQVDEVPGYDDEERIALLSHLQSVDPPSIYDLSIMLMFCFTVRIGELRALKWSDIRDNYLHIDKQIDSIEVRATNRCIEAIRLQQSKSTPLTVRGHEHDFDYLLYLASLWNDKVVDTKELWDALLCGIQNGEEKWYGTIDNIVLMNWSVIGRVLAVQGIEETKRVLQLLNVRYEGYNIIELSKLYKSVTAECYMFGVVLMSVEKYNKKRKLKILRLVTENILSQCYYCQNDYIIEQYYYAPLLTIALLCDQRIPTYKNIFEKKVILSGLPLEIVLKILSLSKHFLNEANRGLLKKRLNQEWNVQRRIMLQKQQLDVVKMLDKFIHKL